MKKHSKPSDRTKGKRSEARNKSVSILFSTSSKSAELIKHVRGQRTQQEFAAWLGVSRTAVSGWEIGDLNPPPEIWIKLGNWAHPDEAVELWRRGGIDLHVLSIAGQRLAKKMYSHPGEGDMVQVKPIPTIAQESSRPPSDLMLSQEWVSNPTLTEFLRFDDLSSGYGMEPGDVLIVDTSDRGAPNLFPFWRKRILLETDYGRPIQPHNDRRCTKIWVVGSLNLKLQFSSAKRFHWGAIVQPWTDGFHLDPVVGDEKPIWTPELAQEYGHTMTTEAIQTIETRTLNHIQGPLLVGNWECEVPPGVDAATARAETAKRALGKLSLDPGQRILGRVTGWLRPPRKI